MNKRTNKTAYTLPDHKSLDYTLDRIGQLEGRGLELDRARNATVEMLPKSL